MNLDEAAKHLRVSRATLDRWIRQGLMAEAGLHGGRFDRTQLDAWAARRGIAAAPRRRNDQPARHLLADACQRGAVTMGTGLSDSAAAISLGVTALDLGEADRERLLEACLERERLASTGLGRGVALPHPREPLARLVHEPRLSVVFLDPAVDWAAIDGVPVSCAIVLASPDAATHLQLISRLAHALRTPQLDEVLARRPDREELAEHLREIPPAR